MIERNVIEQVCSGVQKATTAVVLTHNIDFLFIETILLPRLRELGSPQLTIFADAACAANTFRAQERLVTKLGSRYRVVPADLGTARRFHPKAILLYGDEGASLVIGSGNATHGGWSSNQEVWCDFIHPGDGGAEIAAFISYLERILGYVPGAANIRNETLGNLASPSNVWLGSLPPPSGLAWTPGPTSLLDQVLDATGREVISIDVLSPYFDPSALALLRLSELSSGSTRVFLQPGKAGLSRDLAAKLRPHVKLQTIEANAEERRYKFIHAKSYVFETSNGQFLVTGSANCSRAALLADETWGNAELVAIQRASEQTIAEFWSGYSFTNEAPVLPEVHPAEEWTVDTTELRILGARKDGERLEVFFKTEHEVVELKMHSQEPKSQTFAASELGKDRASFVVAGTVSSVWLTATIPGGSTVTSSPSWVDDERSLSVGGAERSLRERLESAAARGSLFGNEFLQIVELFDQHIQRPSGQRGPLRTREDRRPEPVYFSEADIYTDKFPDASPLFSAAFAAGGFNEADALSLIHSFFQTESERQTKRTSNTKPSDEDREGEDQEPEDVQRVTNNQMASSSSQKFVRLFKRIKNSLAHPNYASSRSPARLSSDLAALAILMSFARLKGAISPADYRSLTMAMWKVLFFGETGNDGAVLRHLAQLPELERGAVIGELRSAKLTAAMATWCMIDWANANSEARKFRFAAAELASRHRWLSEGADREAVLAELDRIAAKLLPDGREQLMKLWSAWLRDGHSVHAFSLAVADVGQRKLAEESRRLQLRKGELVWQSGKGFCVVVDDCDRSTFKKATLAPVDQREAFKVQSDFVAPIADLLRGQLPISDHVKRQISDLIHATQEVVSQQVV